MGERPKTKSLSQVFVLILLSKVVLKSKSCNLLYVNELFRTTFDILIVLITSDVGKASDKTYPLGAFKHIVGTVTVTLQVSLEAFQQFFDSLS